MSSAVKSFPILIASLAVPAHTVPARSAPATASALRSLSKSFDRVLTRRKPTLMFSIDGSLLSREDEVQRDALLFQLPPRLTRSDPEEEYRSRHHSHTLPCMS